MSASLATLLSATLATLLSATLATLLSATLWLFYSQLLSATVAILLWATELWALATLLSATLATLTNLLSATPRYFQLPSNYSTLRDSTKLKHDPQLRENEHFVGDLLHFWHLEAENRRSSARFSYKAVFASATFQGTHQMLPLPRLLALCHVCAAMALRFINTAPSPPHKILCLPRNYNCNCKIHQHKSAARARENERPPSESLKRQKNPKEAFRARLPSLWHLEAENRRFPADFPKCHFFTQLKKYYFCEASATFQSTHKRCPCHDFWKRVRFAWACHCDSGKQCKTASSPRHKKLRLPRNCRGKTTH